MPLQIRRGTTAERLSITPLVSELIYDTTLKLVFVGDGTTAGGVAIDQDSSPNLPLGQISDVVLTDVDVGEIIKFDGENWVNSEFSFNDLVGIEINTPEANQVLKFNGTTWTNENEDSSLLVSALGDLSDVVVTDPVSNQFLKYDGANWVNSNVFDGDVTGSVFADNSTLLVDGVTGQIVGDINARLGGNLNLNNFSINGTGEISITGGVLAANSSGKRVQLVALSNLSAVNISTVRSSETIPVDEKIGQITFRYTDNTGTADPAVIISRKEGLTIAVGSFDDDKLFKIDSTTGNASFGILPSADYKLSVNGNIFVTGRAYSDVVGSLFADDSTLVIDGTSGNIVNLSFAGEVGNVPTDAVTVDSWLEVSVNGVTKYIPLYS